MSLFYRFATDLINSSTIASKTLYKTYSHVVLRSKLHDPESQRVRNIYQYSTKYLLSMVFFHVSSNDKRAYFWALFCNHTDRKQSVILRCSIKKVFLKILQSSLENTCACQSLFLNKVAGLRRFPVNFAKFSRAPFSIEHLR